MSYRLPPLNGVRAFEAAARHLSFKRAANELCVTPGAVSQQVKALETSLGVKLFRRLPRGLLLTAAGERYLPSISEAFHIISEVTKDVAPTLRARSLRLGIEPTISAKDYPAIEALKRGDKAVPLKLMKSCDLSALIDGELDALLRRSMQPHPNLHLDIIDLRAADGTRCSAALMTLPGLAGCLEHRVLVKRLRG
jgi:LysR family transcriptional regulator, glycine cleavage system transcriptional activator